MHGSKSEFGALELVLAISPSFDLGITHHFFSWTPYSSRKIFSKFHNFYQQVRPVGVRFNWFIELACMEHWFWWFWRLIPTWIGPISSRSVLAYIGPWFGFLAAHHESIWILGGEASWKLKGVSLHGELVRRVIGECGFKVEGLFSRAECMGKWMEAGGWFVPTWCISWFVSSWCSLIEGVINKIYNLLHHILG